MNLILLSSIVIASDEQIEEGGGWYNASASRDSNAVLQQQGLPVQLQSSSGVRSQSIQCDLPGLVSRMSEQIDRLLTERNLARAECERYRQNTFKIGQDLREKRLQYDRAFQKNCEL